MLDVIVPVYNERNTIGCLLADWDQALRNNRIDYRFLIVEDGSTDGTYKELKKLQRKYPMYINHSATRRRYGNAVLAGISLATAPYLFHVDSDGQYDPTDVSRLWKLRTASDVVMGVRTKRNDPFVRKFGSFLFSLYFRLLFPSRLKDPSTPFVLYRRSAVIPFQSDLMHCSEAFWWGFSGMCRKRSLSVAEVSIRHTKRIDGTSRVFSIKTLPAIVMNNTAGLLRLRWA